MLTLPPDFCLTKLLTSVLLSWNELSKSFPAKISSVGTMSKLSLIRCNSVYLIPRKLRLN